MAEGQTTRPKFFLVGGANGAGKSTFIEGNFPPDRYEIVQPDKIREQTGIKDDLVLAGLVGDRLRQAVAGKKDIVFEHNLHTMAPIDNLEAYKKQGYERHMIYPGVGKLQTNIDRGAERAKSGQGHDVDKLTFGERRIKGLTNVKAGLKVADVTIIIDNAPKQPQINLKFKEGLVDEKKPNQAEWVRKEFDLPVKLAGKLGRKPQENDHLKITR